MAWDCIESRTLVPGCKCKSLVSCPKSHVSDDQANFEIGEKKKFKNGSKGFKISSKPMTWKRERRERVDSKVVENILLDLC